MITDLLVNIAASVVYDFGKSVQGWASQKEMVQVALKQLNLSKELHDFPERYLEALVQLRFDGKSKAVLELFREESIQNTFYNYLYGPESLRHNVNELEYAMLHHAQALRVGEAAVKAGVDVPAEVQCFWTVFKQKVQESRTVKEVEVIQQIQYLSTVTHDMKKLMAAILAQLQQGNANAIEIGGVLQPVQEETIRQLIQLYIGTPEIAGPSKPGAALPAKTFEPSYTGPIPPIQAAQLKTIKKDKSLSWSQRLFFRFINKRKRRDLALQTLGLFNADERRALLQTLDHWLPIQITENGEAKGKPFLSTLLHLIADPANDGKFYLILGETGAGKSTGLLHLFLQYALQGGAYRILFVPFYKDYRSVFEVPAPEKCILILDGIDEAPEMLQDPEVFFSFLENKVRNFAKVIISCRMQFFVSQTAERAATDTRPPKPYQKVYLEFLSIETVRQYVGDRYKPGTPEYIAALSMVNQTETLLKRPLLLSYISDMVERRNQFLFYHSTPGLAAESGTVTQYELYETILQKWINREKELSAAAGKDYSQLLREVSLQLALSIFYQEGRKNIYYADLKKIVEQQQLPLSEIQLRDRSLLRRNREGYYNFAHRTFKEFFFAQLLYEGRIPEAGFPAAQYEDAEKFYNQMGEVLYFRHNGGPLAAKNIYRPGLITFPPLPESTWPRPVQIFAHLHHIPLGEDASAVYESFLRIAFYQMFIDLGRSFTQEERRQQEAAYRDLLTDVARFLITASEESVSRSYLENLQQENGNAGLIGDLIKLFFFCQSGDRFHFLHRSFAEFLCLRELLDQDEPEVITAFPLHQLRFTRLFANEISWLQLRSRYPGVALLLDNFQLSNEDFRASGFDDWYEYYSSKAGVDYPGFLQRLHQSEGHLCIRADQPLEEDFWRYLPFAGHIKTLDVAHFRLEGGDLRLLTNLQTLCLYGTHSTAVLQLPPGLQHIEVDPASAVPGLPPLLLRRKKDRLDQLAGQSLSMPEMVSVPAGRFWMGSRPEDENATDDELPRHLVAISAFEMARHPITLRQFAAFVQDTGYITQAEKEGFAFPTYWNENTLTWYLKTGVDWTCDVKGLPAGPDMADHPVLYVSWHDAVAYCEWLGKKRGKKCRLPTEAEWEYAAIGGMKAGMLDVDGHLDTTQVYAGSNAVEKVAWHWEKLQQMGGSLSRYKHQQVGALQANALGLYDMSGNVYEWCGDWYDAQYYEVGAAEGVKTDPKGPDSGSYRVIRGGSWGNNASYCRVAHRGRYHPFYRDYHLGFRPVLLQ